MELQLVLDNIRSVQNVGAIFRTADAVGVKKIYLVGYTPTPLDRFGRVRADMHKSALGAEESVPWVQAEDVGKVISDLRIMNYEIVALEQDKRSQDYKLYKQDSGKLGVALIVGNEVGGVDKKVLEMCDAIIEIPMRGIKESLNVSVATGIALYSIAGCP